MKIRYFVRILSIIICQLLFISAYSQNESANNEEMNFMRTTEVVSPFESPISSKLRSETRTKQTEVLVKLYDLKKSKSEKIIEIQSIKKRELASKAEKNVSLLQSLSNDEKKLTSEVFYIDRDIFKIKDFKASKNQDKQMMKILADISKDRFPSMEQENVTPEEWNAEFDHIENTTRAKNLYDNDCSIAFNGIDPNTLQKKLQTNTENLISYTHPKLEEYYKEESFLTGEVSIVVLGKNTFMTLDVTIKSKDAIKNYGMIQAGSPLKIELINGESVYLFAQVNAQGRLVPRTSSIVYQILYLLDKNEYKLLKKSEINNIGLMWSSGYEKYDIYNIDVVKNQIECIEKF